MYTPADNNAVPSSDQQPNKRRRKKSIVWEHFTIETIDADCTRAFCKQCKKSFAYITGSKLAGTSHLLRHITLGICPVSRLNRDNNQQSPYTPVFKTDGMGMPRKRYRSNSGFASFPFDQDHCNHEIAKMIIMHEYPLEIVEHAGFKDFVRALQPHFNMGSINTVEGDCVGVYLREKQGILKLLGGSPSRVGITLDFWTSVQDAGYVSLTGHFIDNDWKLQQRVLNVMMLPFPDSEVAFSHAVVACLAEWSLESKLFTLTVDHSFANENVWRSLSGLLSIKGQLLIGNCYARTLTRLAQNAMDSMQGVIKKVRDSVKYVKALEAHEERFTDLKQQLQVPSTKSLIIDDQTKWNTTYHMLVAASELKEVFCCLDTSDPNYKETPSMDEWKQVELLCVYLKLFHDAANVLTAPLYPTSNIFFHDVWKIQLELMHAATSPDTYVSNLTKPIHETFDKYWRDCFPVLAMAVIMDPRFKMRLLEFSFRRIYGDDAENWIRFVDEKIRELFHEYIVLSFAAPNFVVEANEVILEATESIVKTEVVDQETLLSSTCDGLEDFDVYISDLMDGQQIKTELDQYLEESILPRVQDFDILDWWNLNSQKFPTLSKMACDLLSMPISTVAPCSVFDTESKKMDSYRSSLRPLTVQALLCAKDWLQYGPSEISNAVVKREF